MAKESLSKVDETEIIIEGFGMSFNSDLTREVFEDICSDIWPKILEPIQAAIQLAGLTIEKIEQAIVTGGTSRIPKVRSTIEDYFGKSKVHICEQPE